MLDLLDNSQGEVRGAAIRALGALGDKDDVPRLIKLLGEADSQQDAVAAITRLHGEGINAALCGEMKTAAPAQRVKLLQLLVARHAIDSRATLLEAAKDGDAGVRIAALEALGQLAGPELVARLAHLVLDAKDAAAREEAERALALIAQRESKGTRQAGRAAFESHGRPEREAKRRSCLPALGRIGGKPALKASKRPWPTRIRPQRGGPASAVQLARRQRGAAIGRICRWRPRIPAERKLVVDALIRVAPLPDKRPDAVRLTMLKKAMELASSDEQKTLVLKRARRSVRWTRCVSWLPYMDQPEFTQVACQDGRRTGPSQGAAAAEQGRVRQGPRQGASP